MEKRKVAYQAGNLTGMRTIGYVGIIVGIFLILSSIFAGGYSIRQYVGVSPIGFWQTDYPYRGYSFPLAIVGIIALIVGVAFLMRVRALAQ